MQDLRSRPSKGYPLQPSSHPPTSLSPLFIVKPLHHFPPPRQVPKETAFFPCLKMMRYRSIEVKFPVQIVHLCNSDLILLVGVESRHEDVDLAVRHHLVSPAPLHDLLQVLPSNVPLLLSVELLEQLLHPLTQVTLRDQRLHAVTAEAGGILTGCGFDSGVTLHTIDWSLVDFGLITPHSCLLS